MGSKPVSVHVLWGLRTSKRAGLEGRVVRGQKKGAWEGDVFPTSLCWSVVTVRRVMEREAELAEKRRLGAGVLPAGAWDGRNKDRLVSPGVWLPGWVGEPQNRPAFRVFAARFGVLGASRVEL